MTVSATVTVALPSVKVKHSAKVAALPSAVDSHSAKVAIVPSATGKTLGKQATFAKCLAHGTWQICDVYRVQWPLHSAKHVPR